MKNNGKDNIIFNEYKDGEKYKPDGRRKTPPHRNGWTPERRAAQAARAKRDKPWEKSTGPKTNAGKEAAKQNAFRHGFRSERYRELCRLLRVQKAFVRLVAQNPDLDPGEYKDFLSRFRDQIPYA